MEEFLIRNIVGILLTQFVIAVGAIVKLWFNFQTLKRDFDKKEVTDEKILNKEEKRILAAIEDIKRDLAKQGEKLEMKIDVHASSLEKFKEEIRIDGQSMRDSMTKVMLKQDIYNEKINTLELNQISFKLDTQRKSLDG